MKVNSHKLDSLPVPDAAALAHSQTLLAEVAARIRANGGWLPFDRYMECVLYTPGLGYYSGGAAKFGRRGDDGSDFVTAPELTPLFAQTISRALAEALQASGTTQVMEFGAGTGKLAAGILAELDALGVPCERYWIVELSGELRERQRATLAAAFAGNPQALARVQWLDALPERFDGVMLGNEVVDAMPVKLYRRSGGVWHERGVALDDAPHAGPAEHAAVADTLASDRRDASHHGAAPAAPALRLSWADRVLAGTAAGAAAGHAVTDDTPALADAQTAALLAQIEGDEDYLTEACPAAAAFAATLARMLGRGALLLIDYGFPRHEYLHPQRSAGTLMCHYRHRAHGDPFFYPGLQDITAHVDFTAIAEAGLAGGLDLLGYTSQARFLINCGITEVLSRFDPSDLKHYLPAANAVQKLLSEAEMGELFKVIGFARGIDGTLSGFARGDRSHTL
jgi:SAM-dependent MidA family methyltransferase